MDYIANSIQELISILKEINANQPVVAIIPSCTGEFDASGATHSLELDDQENMLLDFFIYTNYDDFKQDVAQSISTLDLTEGADDQYYDYNPACFESLLYAAHQLPALEKSRLYHSLLEAVIHYNDWIIQSRLEGENPEVIDQYEYYANHSIENDDLEGLEGYEIYEQLINAIN